MAKRPKKNDIPAKKPPMNSGIFQKQPRATKTPYEYNHKVGGGGGLTTNRQKPGGGAGSGGPTTDVG